MSYAFDRAISPEHNRYVSAIVQFVVFVSIVRLNKLVARVWLPYHCCQGR
jgi:hypothetical protein